MWGGMKKSYMYANNAIYGYYFLLAMGKQFEPYGVESGGLSGSGPIAFSFRWVGVQCFSW